MQRLIVSQKIKIIFGHIWLTKYLRFPTQPQQLAFAVLTTAVKLYSAHYTYDRHGYNGQLVIVDKNRSPKPNILSSRHSFLVITDKLWPQCQFLSFFPNPLSELNRNGSWWGKLQEYYVFKIDSALNQKLIKMVKEVTPDLNFLPAWLTTVYQMNSEFSIICSLLLEKPNSEDAVLWGCERTQSHHFFAGLFFRWHSLSCPYTRP